MKKLALFALAALLVTGVSMTASAEDTRSLTQQQRDALWQHAKSVTPEKRQQLREDPSSRAQFVRDASASLPPDQRKELEARFKAMTEQQRAATIKRVFEEGSARYQDSLSQ